MTYIPSSKEEVIFLKNYDPSEYKNPAVAADTALFSIDDDAVKILLIKRGGFPYKNCWAIPGGFVNIDEDIKDSAQRELLEETGLADIYLEQAFVWGKADRDPRDRVITVSYIALTDFAVLSPKAGDDAIQAEWFAIQDYKKEERENETIICYTLHGIQNINAIVAYPKGRIQEITSIESGGLAFDHAESIAFSFETLKQRIEHSDFLKIAFKDKKLRAHAKKVILKD